MSNSDDSNFIQKAADHVTAMASIAPEIDEEASKEMDRLVASTYSDEDGELIMDPADRYIFAVVGPSGVGKTTITRWAAENIPDLHEVVSVTTRSLREGEVDGVDYNFLSLERAREMVDNGEFLEHAEYHGNIYGNAHKDLVGPMRQGNDLVIVIERHGLQQLKEAYGSQVVSLMVVPPSLDVLEQRLWEDGGRTEAEIQARLMTAAKEIEDEAHFDEVLINDDLEECCDDLRQIIKHWRAQNG